MMAKVAALSSRRMNHLKNKWQERDVRLYWREEMPRKNDQPKPLIDPVPDSKTFNPEADLNASDAGM